MELALAVAGFAVSSLTIIFKVNAHLDKRFDFIERRLEVLHTSFEGNQRLVDHRLEVLENQQVFATNGNPRK